MKTRLFQAFAFNKSNSCRYIKGQQEELREEREGSPYTAAGILSTGDLSTRRT